MTNFSGDNFFLFLFKHNSHSFCSCFQICFLKVTLRDSVLLVFSQEDTNASFMYFIYRLPVRASVG